MYKLLKAWLLALVCVCSSYAQTPNAPSGLNVSANPINLSVAGLHVVGNKILNGFGQGVPLRGVDQDGIEYMCLDGTSGDIFDPTMGTSSASVAPGATTLAAFKSWGINSVRLPVNESCWLNINGATTGGSTYQTAVENYVSYLTSNNIAVIIDLQWVGPGSQLANLWCNGQFAPLPDLDHAPAFWTSVANAFKSNSSVLFDLYNEPLPNNNADDATAWGLLLNGGAVTTSNSGCPSGYTAVGTQSLVNTIRATGATNIIDVPGTQFANSLTQWLSYEPTDTLSPPQIAAAWHSYANQVCNNLSCWTSVVGPVAAQVPVNTEEIGENDCQGIYIGPFMVWADTVGVNYWVWSWNSYPCGSFPATVTNAMTGAPTYTFGSTTENHLQTLAGLPLPAPVNLPQFQTSYPYGIAIGRSTSYTAGDGTVYYPDITTTGLLVKVNNNPPNWSYSFNSFTTADTITGTPDPTLYQTGRQGCCGEWDINVQNGSYTVTLDIAPNSTYGSGQYGQDQIIQGVTVNGCVWSNTPSSGGGCGVVQTNPAIDTAATISYTVNVYNEQLAIEVAASEGGGRTTILNAIKIVQNSVATIPPTPTGLSATPGNAQVSLSWTASSGATDYNILRASTTSGIYTQVGLPTSNSFVDTNVVNFQTYCYVISAATVAGSSANTSPPVCTTPITTPGIPTGLAAFPGNTTVNLTWSSVLGATSYNVLRSTTSGSGYTQIGTPSTPSYGDTGRTNGTTYYYVVQAHNSAGSSGNSSQVSATPSATGTWTQVESNTNENQTVCADPANAGTLYSTFEGSGLFKSTDYGQTWSGPINTGTLGSNITTAGGSGISCGANGLIFFASIRNPSGNLGLYKSTDGGVDWTYITLSPAPGQSGAQDIYYPQPDPYKGNHWIITGHENPTMYESFDTGATWTQIPLASGMTGSASSGGTAFAYFVNGTAADTNGYCQTYIWIMQQTGGNVGTWRTANGTAGTPTWAQVNSNEHGHGTSSMYQPNTTGTIFMAGAYFNAVGGFSSGIIVSQDYGATWNWASSNAQWGNFGANLIAGDSSVLYAANGAALEISSSGAIDYITSPSPGTGATWTNPSTITNPTSWTWGVGNFLIVNDGTHNIVLVTTWVDGIWRYVEP